MSETTTDNNSNELLNQYLIDTGFGKPIAINELDINDYVAKAKDNTYYLSDGFENDLQNPKIFSIKIYDKKADETIIIYPDRITRVVVFKITKKQYRRKRQEYEAYKKEVEANDEEDGLTDNFGMDLVPPVGNA